VTLPVDHGRPGVMARSGNSEDSRFVRFFGWSSAETSAIHCQVLTPQVTGHLRGPRLPCDRRARVVVSPHSRSRRRKVIITTLAVTARYFLEVTRSSCPGPARQVTAPPAGRLRMPPGTVTGCRNDPMKDGHGSHTRTSGNAGDKRRKGMRRPVGPGKLTCGKASRPGHS